MMLFEPLKIKGLELKNRIVMPSMGVGVGLRGRRARAFYGERARGGVGAIIAGGTPVDLFVSDEAWDQAGALDSFIDGLRTFTSFIGDAGAKMGMQLWHGNRYPAGNGTRNDPRGEPVAPSTETVPVRGNLADGLESDTTYEKRRGLTTDEVRDIIAKFGNAAAKVKEAGFDFVEVNGCHVYLPCQFFSPAHNHRNDEYGGDLLKRMRFGLDCVKAMRAAVDEDYPIFFRLGTYEDGPGGITLEDSIEFAIQLEKAGVDVLNVSVGEYQNQHLFEPSREERMGCNVWIAEGIKKRVGIPVITVGRINSHKIAESILTQGRADLIAIGRQLIADPFWPKKVMEGRTRELVACKSCSPCPPLPATPGPGFSCIVNPLWEGRELKE
ncbi:tRNA-dihydrouridine synthase [Chloroflexota bacterium]